MRQLVDKLKNFYSIDARALAAFRVILALMLLFDLSIRFPDIKAHYTDEGLMSRENLMQTFPQNTQFSLYMMTGTEAGMRVLFFIQAIFALMFLFGIKTLLSTVVSWVLLISLQSRNELVLHGGDHYLRILFLWAMFLPLDRTWAWGKEKLASDKTLSTLPTLILLLQMGVVYWFAAWLKSGKEWVSEGTALYYALNVTYLKMPLGEELLRYPGLMKFLTFSTLWLEALAPFLFFLPQRFARTRTVLFLSLVSFHLGIGATLYLGSLPYVFMIPLVVILPTAFWDRIEPRVENYRMSFQRFLAKLPRFEWKSFQKPALTALLLFLGVYQLLENFDTKLKVGLIPQSLTWVANTLRIDQDWGMFAPYPYKRHGWYVIEGETEIGEKVKVVNREPAASDPDSRPYSKLYLNGHWLSYAILTFAEHQEQLMPFADYLCRNWSETHEGPALSKIHISYQKFITPDKPDVMIPHRENLLSYECTNWRGNDYR